ncbi:preprotein translocase subunit SecE [PVC group bacterium]|nr:preprotein translocase subunit SecE [PVC group bacterium]MCH7590822.1 preprotein translocase subunit SecE [PVC group bacterium]
MNWIGKIKEYFKNVKLEMQKVSWPTKSDIKGSTSVVIVTLFIVGAFIGAVDFLLSSVIGLLIR